MQKNGGFPFKRQSHLPYTFNKFLKMFKNVVYKLKLLMKQFTYFEFTGVSERLKQKHG